MSTQRGLVLRWALAGIVTIALLALCRITPAHAFGGSGFSTHTLNGRYITAGNASDASITDGDSDDDAPARAFVASAYLVFDGHGNVTSGEETINYGVPGTGDSFTCELTGTYTVDSTTGRMIMTLTSSAGPALTDGESNDGNSAQCGGTSVTVGYISSPAGKAFATVQQTVVPGTPTPPIAANTPILSAHVWSEL